MSTNDRTTAVTRAEQILRHEFGEMVDNLAPEGPLMVSFPGGDYSVVIFVGEGALGPVLRIVALVTDQADWGPGLAEFLLREGGTKIFGRFERVEDGISIEHTLFSDTSGEALSFVVRALADTAIRLERDLFAMGALTAADRTLNEEREE